MRKFKNIIKILIAVMIISSFVMVSIEDVNAKPKKKYAAKKRKTKKKKKTKKVNVLKKGNSGENEIDKKLDDLDKIVDAEIMHFYTGLKIGFLIPMGELKDALKPGLTYGGLFQYNKIYKGLGLELDFGYVVLTDKEFENSGITLINALLFPHYTFYTTYIDIAIKAGAGISSVKAQINDVTISSNDLTVGGGLAVQKSFGDRFLMGVDIKYYYIFETLAGSAISTSIYAGVKF